MKHFVTVLASAAAADKWYSDKVGYDFKVVAEFENLYEVIRIKDNQMVSGVIQKEHCSEMSNVFEYYQKETTVGNKFVTTELSEENSEMIDITWFDQNRSVLNKTTIPRFVANLFI